ncbi:TPA: phage tail protein [Enterobacter hormaechei]|uniref:phage tail-collar fiber domain-containing protein n=1 Tax=Enterobacter hormaechei TaxID=158836 RepID=UPI001253290D|nr:phage tail protein [Enterobacter hormaechei]VAC19406.1 phage tail collar domain-containing protein [Enterobacter hormaechei]
MATKYYAVLTNVGAAKLANATALGAQVEITQMAVGDGNGILPTPNPAQTALVHELRRAPLNSLSIDPNNANQIIAEQVIPEDVGGWWIREIGLFDKDGDMIAVANCAETYKPQLQEGSGRVQVVRMILIVSSTAAVTLKIDPSVVLATRQYVDDQIIQVKAYVDQQLAAHVAAADPHTQYLLEADIDKYIPVGFPLPWPKATPPGGWLKCNGATFDKAKYPKLAAAYPSGALPDLRGEFLRGWDDGRGVDSGRVLVSAQGDAIRNISGQIFAATSGNSQYVFSGANGAFSQSGLQFGPNLAGSAGTGDQRSSGVEFSASRQVPTALENRPRNIAFNYIVRAA